MLRTILCILTIAGTAFAQTDDQQFYDAFKKEARTLQAAVDDAVNSVLPINLQPAKATYLAGFGAVVTIEAAFEPTNSPFSSPKSPAELKKLVTERKAAIRQKIENLVKQQVASLASIGPEESIAIVVHLFNSNPVALPNQPSQIVFTAKKQEPDHVTIREF